MYPYWLLFAVWAAGAVQAERRTSRNGQLIFFVIASLMTTLMIGLRFEVGGDWGAYGQIYETIFFLDLPAALATTDPGYAALNWISGQVGLGISFVNLVCATLFIIGLCRLAWKQPNPALAMLIAVPYLIIVVAMGYTRQAAAIGLICFAIADASENRLTRIVVLILIATLFHKTAILILPLTLVPIFRRNFFFGVIGLFVFIVLAVLALRDSSDRLMTNYVQGDYDSQGAAIRVSMNVLASITFLSLRKRIEMIYFQNSFWTTCSIFSIFSVVALGVSSASAGIDRISLYFIPLQIVIYSHLPTVLSRYSKSLPSILIGVILYSFLVQFVWLNFADNANYWVPYSLKLDM